MAEIRVMIVDDEVLNGRFWPPIIKQLPTLGANVIPKPINEMSVSAIKAASPDDMWADLYVLDNAQHPDVLQFINAKVGADFSRWRANISVVFRGD